MSDTLLRRRLTVGGGGLKVNTTAYERCGDGAAGGPSSSCSSQRRKSKRERLLKMHFPTKRREEKPPQAAEPVPSSQSPPPSSSPYLEIVAAEMMMIAGAPSNEEEEGSSGMSKPAVMVRGKKNLSVTTTTEMVTAGVVPSKEGREVEGSLSCAAKVVRRKRLSVARLMKANRNKEGVEFQRLCPNKYLSIDMDTEPELEAVSQYKQRLYPNMSLSIDMDTEPELEALSQHKQPKLAKQPKHGLVEPPRTYNASPSPSPSPLASNPSPRRREFVKKLLLQRRCNSPMDIKKLGEANYSFDFHPSIPDATSSGTDASKSSIALDARLSPFQHDVQDNKRHHQNPPPPSPTPKSSLRMSQPLRRPPSPSRFSRPSSSSPSLSPVPSPSRHPATSLVLSQHHDSFFPEYLSSDACTSAPAPTASRARNQTSTTTATIFDFGPTNTQKASAATAAAIAIATGQRAKSLTPTRRSLRVRSLEKQYLPRNHATPPPKQQIAEQTTSDHDDGGTSRSKSSIRIRSLTPELEKSIRARSFSRSDDDSSRYSTSEAKATEVRQQAANSSNNNNKGITTKNLHLSDTAAASVLATESNDDGQTRANDPLEIETVSMLRRHLDVDPTTVGGQSSKQAGHQTAPQQEVKETTNHRTCRGVDPPSDIRFDVDSSYSISEDQNDAESASSSSLESTSVSHDIQDNMGNENEESIEALETLQAPAAGSDNLMQPLCQDKKPHPFDSHPIDDRVSSSLSTPSSSSVPESPSSVIRSHTSPDSSTASEPVSTISADTGGVKVEGTSDVVDILQEMCLDSSQRLRKLRRMHMKKRIMARSMEREESPSPDSSLLARRFVASEEASDSDGTTPEPQRLPPPPPRPLSAVIHSRMEQCNLSWSGHDKQAGAIHAPEMADFVPKSHHTDPTSAATESPKQRNKDPKTTPVNPENDPKTTPVNPENAVTISASPDKEGTKRGEAESIVAPSVPVVIMSSADEFEDVTTEQEVKYFFSGRVADPNLMVSVDIVESSFESRVVEDPDLVIFRHVESPSDIRSIDSNSDLDEDGDKKISRVAFFGHSSGAATSDDIEDGYVPFPFEREHSNSSVSPLPGAAVNGEKTRPNDPPTLLDTKSYTRTAVITHSVPINNTEISEQAEVVSVGASFGYEHDIEEEKKEKEYTTVVVTNEGGSYAANMPEKEDGPTGSLGNHINWIAQEGAELASMTHQTSNPYSGLIVSVLKNDDPALIDPTSSSLHKPSTYKQHPRLEIQVDSNSIANVIGSHHRNSFTPSPSPPPPPPPPPPGTPRSRKTRRTPKLSGKPPSSPSINNNNNNIIAVRKPPLTPAETPRASDAKKAHFFGPDFALLDHDDEEEEKYDDENKSEAASEDKNPSAGESSSVDHFIMMMSGEPENSFLPPLSLYRTPGSLAVNHDWSSMSPLSSPTAAAAAVAASTADNAENDDTLQ